MGRKKIRDKPAAAPTATRKSGSRKVSSSSSSTTHTSQENLFEQTQNSGEKERLASVEADLETMQINEENQNNQEDELPQNRSNLSDDLERSFAAPDSIPTSGHGILLESLESREKFVKMVALHNSKNDELDLEEIIPVLTKDEQIAMWDRLFEFCNDAISQLTGDEESEDDEMCSQVLLDITLVSKLCLGLELVTDDPMLSLKKVLLAFRNNLLALYRYQNKAVDAMAKSLEAWYEASLEDRDEMIKPVLQYLLIRTVSEGSKGSKADVKRIWGLHQTLLSLRLDEGKRKDWLLECIGHPLYLSTPEGIRFNTFLFTLSVPFLQDIYQKIRDRLTSVTVKQAGQLGEVYAKAWAASGGQFQEKLEDNLQSLMDAGLLVNNQQFSPLSKNVLRFLKYFHDDKRNAGLQTMIARLYAPFLWRYVKANNDIVRLNATRAFFSAYPLEDRSQDLAQRSLELESQHTLAAKLLMDDNSEVQVAAITGVSKLLAVNWTLLPSETIKQFIEPIIKDCSRDPDYRVRVTVYQCLATVLNNVGSHVYMKEVLPSLKWGLHDKNERVRASFLDLLLAVKSIKIIKFWDISDLENLLARLEIDRPVVCRPIVDLLLPSFLPKDGDNQTLLTRCMKMVEENRPASRKFYSLAAENKNKMSNLVSLMLGILEALRIFLKNKKETEKENSAPRGQKRKLYNSNTTLNESVESANSTNISSTSLSSSNLTTTSSVTGGRDEELEDPADQHPFNNMETVGGLLDVVCVVWYKVNAALSEEVNIHHRAALEKKAAKSILYFYKHYRETSLSDTVVFLASFLSHSAASIVASYCLSQFKKSTKFEVHVEALCSWRRGDEVLDLVREWISAGLTTLRSTSSLASSSASSTESLGVRFREPDADKPYLAKAIKVMNHLIDTDTTRAILVAKNMASLEEILSTTAPCLEIIESSLGFQGLTLDRVSDLVSLFKLNARLTVLLGIETEDNIERVEKLISWVDLQLIPILNRSVKCMQSAVSLSQQCISHLVHTLASLFKAGLVDEKFIENSLSFASSCMQDFSFVDDILEMLCESAIFSYTSKHGDLYQETIPIRFVKLLKCFSQAPSNKLEGPTLNTIRIKMLKFFRLYQKIGQENPEEKETFDDIAETLLKAILNTISAEVVSQGAEEILSKVEEAVQTNLNNEGEQNANQISFSLGRQADTLKSIYRDLKQLEEPYTQLMLADINKVVGVEALSYTCLAASFTPQNRRIIVDALAPRVEEILQNNQAGEGNMATDNITNAAANGDNDSSTMETSEMEEAGGAREFVMAAQTIINRLR